MPLSPREKQIQQAEQDAAFMETFMDMLARGVWMPWATVDQDGDPVLFATEELAEAYVDGHHGGDSSFVASQVPIRCEPEPDE